MSSTREHEVAFCAQIKSWADALFTLQAELPFADAQIEQYGHGSHKRQDLRFRDRQGQVALCGEVKLPGTSEGRSPHDAALIRDAFQKAENIRCRYFFTWNVNALVLFDRSKWNELPVDRRVKEWSLGLDLRRPEDVTRPDVRRQLQEVFLPQFLADFADIYLERTVDWGMPPDDIFIRSLESHLREPVFLTADYFVERSETDRPFDQQLQEWLANEMQWTFRRGDPDEWRDVLDRAARTLAYVFANRVIFYEAIRARFPDELHPLEIPKRFKNSEETYRVFQRRFQEAVEVTGDYEPIFYPAVKEWAAPHLFAGVGAPPAWASLLTNIQEFNFRAIPYDIVGKIFQRLISPEERHKFGQHFTNEDIVDVVNAFCIRTAETTVLDPSCGSASFLVRAYHRKACLDPSQSHQQLLSQIFGSDIALFAAHLATLNLASRHIEDEENYPFIARRNFFEVEPDKPFCSIPGPRDAGGGRPTLQAISLPNDLGAVVGNPPYVRQELIARESELQRMLKKKVLTKEQHAVQHKQTKEWLQDLASTAWRGLQFSQRADLHCYFWPAAARFLKEDGYFGFLTSSSWLDVEYGFALQGWILENFKLIAVLESLDEPWFEDARVKTCATILQRCSNADRRDDNLVKFVRFSRPIAEILGPHSLSDEGTRQKAADQLRRKIERLKADFRGDEMRVIVVEQRELWRQGLQVAELFARKKHELADTADDADEDEPEEDVESAALEAEEPISSGHNGYGGGKWGRYLRAPDVFFDILRRFGKRFVRLGEIARIRFGVKSGCDAFFMPRDVTKALLAEYPTAAAWRRVPFIHPCERADVARGRLKIIQAGDGSQHPVEAKYLRPEVHSLMQVDRPVMRGAELTRVVLFVNQPIAKINDRFVKLYLKYGETHSFASKKSKSVPVPQRSTCASRPLWYDLTGNSPGIAFWPKSQQYRHIIPANPEGLTCNCNLYDLTPLGLTDSQATVLIATLNSTIVGLFKNFYGRYAGTEGNLKTEVIDVNLLEVPDPRQVTPAVAARLKAALRGMQSRTVGRLVEEPFMECHTAEQVRRLAETPLDLPAELRQADRRQLDDAVLELLGLSDPRERESLIDKLYLETARHFRQVRIVEVQKMEQRARSKATRYSAKDLAEDIWWSCDESLKHPATHWLQTARGGSVEFTIPADSLCDYRGADDLFDATTVFFMHDNDQTRIACQHAEQATLLARLAEHGIRGPVTLPSDQTTCREWLISFGKEMIRVKSRFLELIESRTSLDKLRDQTLDVLMDRIMSSETSQTPIGR